MATPGALQALERAEQSPEELLERHRRCDWGEADAENWAANDSAARKGLRLLSSYRLAGGAALWIITEADRSVTTLLLPSEY
ncbi:hypothetical protein [Capsulimonas corticalis]|uniref:hypothetical protein n=1 Tax=Capsulimonas corticalis TaxID=2219043 RepID=UPI001C3FE3FB|nr:hypothetical protein [Capsulimonas corticalis]